MTEENEYIYSKHDFEHAIEDGLRDVYGEQVGEIAEFIQEKILSHLRYVNWYRFTGRNCVGCVGFYRDCSVAMGTENGRGAWEQAVNGEIYDCPVRTNGTLTTFRDTSGVIISEIDLSDRDTAPYPIVSKQGE